MKFTVFCPVALNVVSSCPVVGFSRSMAKSLPFTATASVTPTMTSCPSSWMAIALARSFFPPKSLNCFPLFPNAVTRAPFVPLIRATPKSRLPPAFVALADHVDVAGGGDGHPVRHVVLCPAAAEIKAQLAVGVERVVQRSVGVQPGDGEVIPVGGRQGEPDDDDLPVRLDRHIIGGVVPAGEVDFLDARAVERLVERPVRVEPNDEEVVVRGPDRDKLSHRAGRQSRCTHWG